MQYDMIFDFDTKNKRKECLNISQSCINTGEGYVNKFICGTSCQFYQTFNTLCIGIEELRLFLVIATFQMVVCKNNGMTWPWIVFHLIF